MAPTSFSPTQHEFLTSVTIDTSGSPSTVTAQTGVTMDVLLQDLENAGLGLTAHPAPGDITIGGALAIDGHGTAIPAQGETIIPGHTYGSVSNLILSVKRWSGTRLRASTSCKASNDRIRQSSPSSSTWGGRSSPK